MQARSATQLYSNSLFFFDLPQGEHQLTGALLTNTLWNEYQINLYER
jgi:hypothetical protein